MFKKNKKNINSEFEREFDDFKELSGLDGRFQVDWNDRYPCLDDKTTVTPFDSHYIYHPAWAARILKQISPSRHVDISSTLNFSVIVSAFIPVDFYDYRPAEVILENLSSRHADLLSLPFEDESINSLSCMHTVEHIGLGRYGDKMDAGGDIKAINELKRVLAPNGNLLFVVPIGKPKIMFNAHRIYSFQQIIDYFSGFKLVEFSLIPDDFSKGIIKNATKELADGQNYACGCFWFKK